MVFNLIACINKNNALGKDGDLLYHIKDDLINFKRVTKDNIVIMGRKTFDSLPNRPLKDRVNIIITRDIQYKQEGCYIVHSIKECYELCEEKFSNSLCFVIGGSEIYNEFIKNDLIDTAFLTEVEDESEGDTYLSDVFHDKEKWELINSSEEKIDNVSSLHYKFNVYELI